MTRSKWKIIYFLKTDQQITLNKKLSFNNSMLNKLFYIHDGHIKNELIVDFTMLGCKVGEFFLCKKVIKHAKQLKRSRKKVKTEDDNNKKKNMFKLKYKFL